MNVKDLVKELVSEINSLNISLDVAKYDNEKLKNQIAYLEEENKALKEKVEDLEF